jgi:molybdate transport system regulatory protein
MKAMSKVWLESEGIQALGRGKAEILEAIESTGSINAAARELDMSYRHAWSAIKAAEDRSGTALLIKKKGGARGGGAELTPEARKLIALYRKLDEDVRSYTDRRYRELFSGEKPSPTP